METIDIQEILERQADLHAPITKWEVETGKDWSGDESVWVWAYVDDAYLADLTPEDRQNLRRQIREAVVRAAGDGVECVYVRFRATSDALAQAL
jgi:hypothetical protein